MATGGSLGAKAVLKRKMSHLLIRLGSAFQPFASSFLAFICKQNYSGNKKSSRLRFPLITELMDHF